MDCNTRTRDCNKSRRSWNFLILIQDGSIAMIMSALISLLFGVNTILNFILVFALSFMTVRMYHRVIGTFFTELVNNGLLRKYLFGQNNAKR